MVDAVMQVLLVAFVMTQLREAHGQIHSSLRALTLQNLLPTRSDIRLAQIIHSPTAQRGQVRMLSRVAGQR